MAKGGIRILGMLGVLALLCACGEAPDKDRTDAAPKSSAEAGGQGQGGQAMPPTEVGVVTLTAQPIELNVELPGRTSAYQISEIRPQVGGIILERLFEEGSAVEKGQPLYQIDPATYQAEYNTAAAQLKRAEAALKSVKSLAGRYKELVTLNAVSKQEYDDAVASLTQAEADVAIAEAARETAEINLNYTKVLSPISGRIGKSAVTPGALVTAAQATPLALVQQLDPIYVDVTQSSADLMKLRREIEAGQIEDRAAEAPVDLILDDLGQPYEHQGTLKFADVTVDEATGNVQIRAVFPNPDGRLLPGLFVRAVVRQGQLSQGLLVPQQAVVRTPDGQAMAWIADAENKAQMVPVETAQAVKDKWVVTKGLKAGDRVIVEGAIKLQPGIPISPVDIGAEQPVPQSSQSPDGDKQGE